MAEIADAYFHGTERPRVTSALSSALAPPTGEGWLAAGDAALSFDPLSSQGLFHALYSGLASAEAAHRVLSGDISGFNDYANKLSEIDRVYRNSVSACYALEARWPHEEFWHRRGHRRG
jgi:flavin-dependent dehydrogenase